MTPDQKLLRNVAKLVCSLAQSKANLMEAVVADDLCDGPDSSRARGTGVKRRKAALTRYQRLINETLKLAEEE